MTDESKLKLLRPSLVIIGIIFIGGIWLLGQLWPSGWLWHESGRSHYHEMIMVVYATLGIFLIYASRNPLKHRSLLWFTAWSSITHGAVMAFQSFSPGDHIGHLWGDVLALFLVAAWLILLIPKESSV